MSDLPPTAVFDCTIFLQALASRKGPAFACWQLVEAGQITLYLSPDVLDEVTEVLNRPELHQRFQALTPERVQVYLAAVRKHAKFIADVPARITYPRDPKDERYLNLAIAINARYIVTQTTIC
jgi:putative PIN family toxin of toxin-antitoxin system